MPDHVWGKTGDPEQLNQDLVSNPNHKNILKVNDVNENDDAKIAGTFINTSDNANARAIKAQGMTEVVANSAGNPASIGLLVNNPSVNANALALKVLGKSELFGETRIDGAVRFFIDVNGGQNV